MALTEEEKEYIIAEAVQILSDENREDLVKLLRERLEDTETHRDHPAEGLDKKKLDGIVWAVTRALLQRRGEQNKDVKTGDKAT